MTQTKIGRIVPVFGIIYDHSSLLRREGERARGTIEAKSIPEIYDRTIPLSEAGDFNSKKMNHLQGKEDRLNMSKLEALETDLRGLKKALPWGYDTMQYRYIDICTW
jgi:hypothetical protein